MVDLNFLIEVLRANVLHALDVFRVNLEVGVDAFNDLFESAQPRLHLLLCGLVITTQLFQKVLAVRASLHGKLNKNKVR